MKPTDFDSIFRLYDRISRERALQPHEIERLRQWVRKKQLADKDKRYYERNRDKRAAYAREYRRKNPEKNREACRRWRQKQAALKRAGLQRPPQ